MYVSSKEDTEGKEELKEKLQQLGVPTYLYNSYNVSGFAILESVTYVQEVRICMIIILLVIV